ncbi:SCAN domain protein [Oopsacas minuta]|uniref:SCAN domain protein n=1 Tax=Oopsacas minuta TaxID=111878 RepID=A0AAV7JN98_9METZ|nr:SCAN domain protein [Oopsacas minuta]
MNLQLQGNLVTLVKCKTVVSSFIGKLTLFKQNNSRREFYQFPHLAGLQISDDDLLAYCEHLEVLKVDMIKRFTDLLELEPPHWLIDPFCVDAPTVPLYLQEELMDLQSDCEEKAHFTMMGYERFWIAIAGRNKFPNLWKVAKLLVLAFPTSYLVERGFSAVVQLLTKQRNRLDISQCGDLRLLLTDMKPDINGIIDEHHAQVHPPH